MRQTIVLTLLFLISIPRIYGFPVLPLHGRFTAPRAVLPMGRRTARAPDFRMTLSKISLSFDFDKIPYAAGIQHIHSPEHVSETHRLGAPFFKIISVDEPNLESPSRTSIAFVCTTLFIKDMHVRMFSRQPNESNLLFFKDSRALYGVKFTVIPTKVFYFQHRCGVLHLTLTAASTRPSCRTASAWTSPSFRATRRSARRSSR